MYPKEGFEKWVPLRNKAFFFDCKPGTFRATEHLENFRRRALNIAGHDRSLGSEYVFVEKSTEIFESLRQIKKFTRYESQHVAQFGNHF